MNFISFFQLRLYLRVTGKVENVDMFEVKSNYIQLYSTWIDIDIVHNSRRLIHELLDSVTVSLYLFILFIELEDKITK